MSRNQKKIISALLTALGSAVGMVAIMELARRFQRRGMDRDRYKRMDYENEERQGAQVEVTRYQGSHQPVDQPDRETIPNTGNPAAGIVDSREPSAGIAAAEIAEYTADIVTPNEGVATEMVNSLIDYLLAFHDLIDRLRARRAETPSPAQRSLTSDDRLAMHERLSRLYAQTPDVGEGNLAGGTREERVYNLIVKVRGALQALDTTDDDLFRINGEVRVEACQLLSETQEFGDRVARARQIYECA